MLRELYSQLCGLQIQRSHVGRLPHWQRLGYCGYLANPCPAGAVIGTFARLAALEEKAASLWPAQRERSYQAIQPVCTSGRKRAVLAQFFPTTSQLFSPTL
jgi:hypothetical protein